MLVVVHTMTAIRDLGWKAPKHSSYILAQSKLLVS